MRAVGLVSLVISSLAAPVFAGRAVYTPYPGATLIFDHSAQQNVFMLEIDLTNPKIRIRVTSPEDAQTATGEKHPMGPQQFARLHGIQLATNGSIGGDPGDEAWMRVSGLVKGMGAMWPLEAAGLDIYMTGDEHTCTVDGVSIPCSGDGLVAISPDNRDILLETVGAISFPDNVVPGAYDVAAGGRPVIVWDGVVVDRVPPFAALDNPDGPSAGSPEPRTAYGFSQDKRTLFLVVVDGREWGVSAGMRTKELGRKLRSQGAWWAYNLDGGGSSAMYIKDWWNMRGERYQNGIVNAPSDGSVRTVPLQIGVHVVEPLGHLRGMVRAGDAESGPGLAGATVVATCTDASGGSRTRSATTSTWGHYELDSLDAGDCTVSASAVGRKPMSRAKLIAAGDINRLHFGLASSSSPSASTARDGRADYAPDLVDPGAANTVRRCFGAIPPGELAATDSDPDFPSGTGGDCGDSEAAEEADGGPGAGEALAPDATGTAGGAAGLLGGVGGCGCRAAPGPSDFSPTIALLGIAWCGRARRRPGAPGTDFVRRTAAPAAGGPQA